MRVKVLPLIFALSLSLIGCGNNQISASMDESEVDIKTGEKQITGRVITINGNDVTLELGSYERNFNPQGENSPKVPFPTDENGQVTGEGERPSRPSGQSPGNRPSGQAPGNRPSGEMPEGFPSGQMPEGFPAGEMPEGFPEGEMPEGFPSRQMPEGTPPSNTEGRAQPNREFKLTGEEVTVRIPVGTPIQYEGLTVDFSQIKKDYILVLNLNTLENGDETVISGEIVSTK